MLVVSKIIRYVVVTSVAVLAGLLALSVFSFPGGYRLYVVQSGSMAPSLGVGSVVVVKPLASYEPGEIITYRRGNQVITHRIVREKEGRFLTKGDANEEPDLEVVMPRNIVGKVVLTLPYAGYMVNLVKQPLGFFLLIVFPAVLVIYGEIRKIKKEVVKIRQQRVMVLVVAFSMGALLFKATGAFYFDSEVSTGNLFAASAWQTWTTPEEFEDLSQNESEQLNQVDTTTQPGAVLLSGAYTPDSHTVALWHFNEASGTTAVDSVDGRVCAFVGSPTWVVANYSTALSFDGWHDYLNCGNDATFNISQGTWEAWVKFDAKPSEVAHLMNPLAKQEQYWIHASSDDSIQVKINVAGTRYIATTGAGFIQSNVWYHVAGTYDGENLKLYVNGTLRDTNSAPSGNLSVTANRLTFATWSSPTDYFQGTIDEVRISDVVRTDFPKDYFASGSVVQAFNAGSEQNWLQLAWDGMQPAGTTLSLAVSTSNDGLVWGPWELTSTTTPIDLTDLTVSHSQYIRWRATLTNLDNSTPILYEVKLYYSSP